MRIQQASSQLSPRLSFRTKLRLLPYNVYKIYSFCLIGHFFVQIDSCESDSKPAEESDSGVELDEEEKADEEEEEEDDQEEQEADVEEGESSSNGGYVEGDDRGAEEDTNKKIVEDEDLGVGDTGEESETDSEDFTDSEDDTVEYMDDGEPIRKCKRGFKILQNCKRFWKASYD